MLLLDTSILINLIALFCEKDLSFYLISFKKELSFLTIITIFLFTYSIIVKLASSSINSSSFITSSSIVSTKFILINNLIRIIYYLYSFVIDISNIVVSREVEIIVNYIASKYSRSRIRSTRVNVIESLFSTY